MNYKILMYLYLNVYTIQLSEFINVSFSSLLLRQIHLKLYVNFPVLSHSILFVSYFHFSQCTFIATKYNLCLIYYIVTFE